MAAVPGWRNEPPGHTILPVLHEGFLQARSIITGGPGGAAAAPRGTRARRTSVRALSSSCRSPGLAGAAVTSGAEGEKASAGPRPRPRALPRLPHPTAPRYR